MADFTGQLDSRIEEDPFFLGHSLKSYANEHNLNDITMLIKLNCTRDTLSALKKCRKPSSLVDIIQISKRFELKENILLDITGLTA